MGGRVLWEFGNMRNGNTFGGDAQYGAVGQAPSGPSPARSGATRTADGDDSSSPA
jgi:hypothetical protein